jgi:peptidyl-prolyl isomerase H (cyclophilin H)
MEETTLADALRRGNPVVFFDVAVAGRSIGTIKMELFKDVAPRVWAVLAVIVASLGFV